MKKTVLMVIATVMLVLAGCSNNSSADTKESTASKDKSEVTIQDANGKITVPKAPKKVVVFDNSALDTMNVLGVGDKVVGAATDNLPDFLQDYKKVESAGGIKEPDLEKINALKPDLIIISGRQQDFQKDLEKNAPTIFFSTDNNDTWGSIQKQVNAIAKIFDKEAKAKKEIALLQEKIDATHKKASTSGKALVLLANEGSISAYGKGSRFGIVHDTFGFKEADDKIKASTHGQNVSYEYVLEKNPAIIFVVDRTKAIGGDDSQNNVAANELVKQTDAGKNQKVISLDPSVWYLAGSGLESVKIMLENVNQAF